MEDPFEPVNRGMWQVNRGLLEWVLLPSGRAYRAVVPSAVRRSITDFARNATYPGRLINHSLQGRWSGAGDESLRFICNTTAGVGGLFDVASRWNIPKSDADFAQTFSRWGWNPHTYIMLPFYGPSDECHTVGLVADKAAEPLNYFPPYSYTSYATAYNRSAELSEDAALFVRSNADAYEVMKDMWTYTSRDDPPDWQVTGKKDLPTLQTLGVATIACQKRDFPQRGRQMQVRLSSTGRDMKFNYWMQPGTAPLVYLAPGLGSHRLSMTSLSLAECLYLKGFSVVSTTSVFHPEFMESASTSAMPAYPPADCQDLLVALTEIDRALETKYPGRSGKRALIGCSMGGFHALYLAAHEKNQAAGLLRFDRYVAIDTPVNLLGPAVQSIDRYFDAPKAWPAGERQARMNNVVHKVGKLAALPAPAAATTTELPFQKIESEFLIGLTFRLMLRDIIYSSQLRNNMGVLRTPLSEWRRQSCYREIMQISYRDYFYRFIVPYFHQRGIEGPDFIREGTLETYTNRLHAQAKIRVLANANDFLLAPRDLAWLQSTFGPSRIKVFPSGGHLGNLATQPVQQGVIDALQGLR